MPRRHLGRCTRLLIAHYQAGCTGFLGNKVSAPAKAVAVRKLHTFQGASINNQLTGRDQQSSYRQAGRSVVCNLPNSFAATPYLHHATSKNIGALTTASLQANRPVGVRQSPCFAARPIYTSHAVQPVQAAPQHTRNLSSVSGRLASSPLWKYATCGKHLTTTERFKPHIHVDATTVQRALRWYSALDAKKRVNQAQKPARKIQFDAASCLSGGPDTVADRYCISEGTVAKYTLPQSMSQVVIKHDASGSTLLNSLLCIQADNNPLQACLLGGADGSNGTLNGSLQKAPASFIKAAASAASATTYQAGASIRAGYSGTGDAPWTLPGPVFSSECDAVNVVGYLVNVPPSGQDGNSVACQRTVADLATACQASSVLAVPGQLLEVALTPGAARSTFKAVTINQVQHIDAAGALTTVTAGSSPTTWTPATSTCSNVLQELHYTVLYDTGGIASVQADLVVGDITLPSPAAAAVVPQQYSVRWLQTQTANKQDGWPRSGNPGYLTGYPVLAGIRSTSGTPHIDRFSKGLPILGAAPDGTCSAAYTRPVKFGVDAISNCVRSMTFAELKAWCMDSTKGLPLLDYLAITPPLLASTGDQQTYIGQWADANALTVGNWTSMNIDTPLPTTSWDEATQTCSNVAQSVQYNFLTAMAGSPSNPQMHITFARTSYQVASWTYNQVVSTTSQGFALRQSVRFVAVDQPEAAACRKGAPPLYPNLPKDIFYPQLMQRLQWLLCPMLSNSTSVGL
ncbi:hypothetical protein WJX72_002192 [[Myrmecia] bisecta]|uniref:Tectonic-1-3 domain-containing protein n=1 Tax=[Myrmecia] bisecta TaxID=41462 RepID=A0AAW1PWY8_9CHLO